jgi:hypothetical protein
MRLAPRTSLVASVAAAGLLFLGACGGSDDSDSDDSPRRSDSASSSPAASDTASSTTSSRPSTSASSSSAGGSTTGSGELTEAGTTLSLGDTATVEWAESSDDASTRIQVTVNKVEQGSRDDFSGSSAEEQLAGFTPYYVDVTYTAEADVPGDYPGPYSDVSGTSSAGARAQTLITIGLDKCKSADFEKTWTAGTSVTGCRALVIPDGQTLDEITFPAGPERSAGVIKWTA